MGARNFVLDGGPDPPTARGRGGGFDAAYAKLLWPVVAFVNRFGPRLRGVITACAKVVYICPTCFGFVRKHDVRASLLERPQPVIFSCMAVIWKFEFSYSRRAVFEYNVCVVRKCMHWFTEFYGPSMLASTLAVHVRKVPADGWIADKRKHELIPCSAVILT